MFLRIEHIDFVNLRTAEVDDQKSSACIHEPMATV